MSEWPLVPFAELYGEPSRNGITVAKSSRGQGIRLVNMRELFAHDYISEEHSELVPVDGRSLGKWVLRDGDLLFGRRSLTRDGAGKVSLVSEPPQPATFESSLIRARLDPNRAIPRFYFYLFKSKLGRELMDTIIEQVAVAGIRSSDLGRLQVPLPPIDEQRRITSVLSALEDLVDTNRRIVEATRHLARTVFDAASVEGEPAPFGEVAMQVREGVSGAGLTPGTPYLGLEHFATDGGGIVGIGDSGSVDSNKSRFNAGDVLYGKLRPYFRKVDRPGFGGVCSTEIWVLRGKEPYGPATVHAVASRPEFTDFAMQGSRGTRMPRADWTHIATMPVAVPPESSRGLIEKYLNELWAASVELRDEIDDLARTRDELLPLLISGRVRVQDVEAVA